MKTKALPIISAAAMVLISITSGSGKAQARDIWDQFSEPAPTVQPPPPRPNYFDQFDTPGLTMPAPLASPNAQAPMRSANYLLPYCKYFLTDRTEGGYNVGFGVGLCAGMIAGIVRVSNNLPDQMSSCLPAGVTHGQEVRVVVAYVEARPERMHEDMYALVVEALHHAWPCSSR